MVSTVSYDGKAVDVWSIGVICYSLLAGYLPFDENSNSALFEKIMRASYKFPKWFSDGAKDLISKILVVDVSKRLTLREIIMHPWILGTDNWVVEEDVYSLIGNGDSAICGCFVS